MRYFLIFSTNAGKISLVFVIFTGLPLASKIYATIVLVVIDGRPVPDTLTLIFLIKWLAKFSLIITYSHKATDKAII